MEQKVTDLSYSYFSNSTRYVKLEPWVVLLTRWRHHFGAYLNVCIFHNYSKV